MPLTSAWAVTVERIRPEDADAARSVLQGVVGSIPGERVDRVIAEGGGIVPALSLEQANSLMTKLYELGIVSHKLAEAPPPPSPPHPPTAFTPSRPDKARGPTRGVLISQWTLKAIVALLLLIAALGTTALVRSMRRDAAAARLAKFAACMQHELDIALLTHRDVGPRARLTAEIKCQNRRDLETPGQSKQAEARTQIELLGAGLDQYRLDVSSYPDGNIGLEALQSNPNVPNWNGPYVKKAVPKDPWGNPYRYRCCPGRFGEYDLWSEGADGAPGGEGENADITSWDASTK